MVVACRTYDFIIMWVNKPLVDFSLPENTKYSPIDRPMLVHRLPLRHWSNIDSTIDECIVFAIVLIIPYSAGTDFSRQNPTSADVRLHCLQTSDSND